MTEYRKHLSEPWFSLIKTGLKTVEGRLNKGDFSEMKEGDIISFFNNDQPFHREFKVRIISTKNYKTFEEYLRIETLRKTLPGVDKVKDGISIYYQWYKKDEPTYGVRAIRIECL